MNVVIWLDSVGSKGEGIELLSPALNTLARTQGNLNVFGAVTPQGIAFNELPVIKKENLNTVKFDLILVTGQNIKFANILKEVAALKIDTNKVIMDRTVLIPNFTLAKYNRLRNSKLSIFSVDYWGGLTYHRLGMQFLSPTVNLFMNNMSFLKFLENSRGYMAKEPVFTKYRIVSDANTVIYPILSIDDLELNMNNYDNVNVAKSKWMERVKRINWFNVLVEMYTDNVEILKRFDKLPYAKKVCFVPFKTDIESGYYIDVSKYPNTNFGNIINDSAKGVADLYDIWDMLLYGKKTPLAGK